MNMKAWIVTSVSHFSSLYHSICMLPRVWHRFWYYSILQEIIPHGIVVNKIQRSLHSLSLCCCYTGVHADASAKFLKVQLCVLLVETSHQYYYLRILNSRHHSLTDTIEFAFGFIIYALKQSKAMDAPAESIWALAFDEKSVRNLTEDVEFVQCWFQFFLARCCHLPYVRISIAATKWSINHV